MSNVEMKEQARIGLFDYLLAAVLAVTALTVSPYVIRHFSGRAELSPRIALISIVLDVFIVVLIGAIVTRGRIRRLFFWLLVASLPLLVLCGSEGLAQAFGLSNYVAPMENYAVLANRSRYPGYLRSDIRSISHEADGLVLYRPWKGEGVTINSLGLRTAEPSPKAPGEWRIAMTGGSTGWGWEVLDADTIQSQLQNILRTRGLGKVTVYNFAVGGRVIRNELDYIKHFHQTYGIDQVIFYTGGNDATYSYVRQFQQKEAVSGLATWELIKTAKRLQARLFPPTAEVLAELDRDVLPRLLSANPIRVGVLAADAYCREAGIRCDFVLQPLLATRKSSTGWEREMQHTLLRLYPRFEVAARQMYADAMQAGPRGRVHDFTTAFDGTNADLFADAIHVNEAGNRMVAERIADAVQFGPR
jgi:lysophospholipase L1-like esterase